MNSKIDLRLMLVFDPTQISNWKFFVTECVRGGVTCVQLRMKKASREIFKNHANALGELLSPLKIPWIVNDRVDVVVASGAKGVHLGVKDLPAKEARRILGEDAVVGLSVESNRLQDQSQIDVADYVAASPVFATHSKVNHAKPWDIFGLKNLCKISPKPVVAIGGVTLENLTEVLNCGVAGVAVISALTSSNQPFETAKKFRDKIDHHLK